MLEKEGHRAVGQPHGYALEEVEQHQEEKVALVLLGKLKEALGRPFLVVAQLGHFIVQGEVGVAHEGCSLARGRRAVEGRVLASMFQHDAVHSSRICIAVLLLFLQRVGGALLT